MIDRPDPPAWEPSARSDIPATHGAAARHLISYGPEQSASAPQSSPADDTSRESVIVGLVLTGYLDTEIRSRVSASPTDRYRWSFGPGIDRTEPLRSASAEVRHLLSTLEGAKNCRVSLGWIDGERRHHLAPGRASLATHISRGRAGAGRRDLIDAASGLGSTLREFRSVDVSLANDLQTPSGPRRLARWLRTGDGPWAAGVMHDRLIALLGATRVDEIISWVDDMPREVLVHGRAGLSATVVSEYSVPSALLTGDEIGLGPADFDMGWVLGELLVSEHMVRYAPAEDEVRQKDLINACRDSFLIAYGPGRDLVTAGRTTTLRVLLELHDFAAYQDRQLDELVVQAAELVDYAR